MSRRFHSRDVSPTSRPRRAAPEQPAPNLLEALEGRVLMHEGPLKVHSVVADNRGEVLISMNQAIRASNVNTGSIQMYTAGPDNVLGTRDDTRVTTQLNYQPTGARVVIRSELPAGTGYRVKLVSARIGSADGHEKLDGEFNGSYPSGNGVVGGNFEFQVKNDKTKTPLVRMSTEEGAVTLLLRGDAAPQTVNPPFCMSRLWLLSPRLKKNWFVAEFGSPACLAMAMLPRVLLMLNSLTTGARMGPATIWSLLLT